MLPSPMAEPAAAAIIPNFELKLARGVSVLFVI